MGRKGSFEASRAVLRKNCTTERQATTFSNQLFVVQAIKELPAAKQRGRLEAGGGGHSLGAKAEVGLEFPDQDSYELWRGCNRRTRF